MYETHQSSRRTFSQKLPAGPVHMNFTSMDCSLPGSSVHGISQARILEWVATSYSRGLEKGMVTHSSILAWRIPRTEEPDGLQSMGVTKSRTQLKRLSTHIGTSLVWPWGDKEWVGYLLFLCSSMNLKDLVFKTNKSYLIIIYFPVFLISHI